MKTSVALCTYNGGKFLSEQLDSILNQTLTVDEIIICDDNSSDETPSILKEYAERFPDVIKIFYNEDSLRVVKNFEKAIQKTTGNIVLLCDQDDLWSENKVEKIVRYFDENPAIWGLFHNLELMDENNHPLGKTMLEKLGVNQNFLDNLQKENKWFEFLLMQNIATGAAMAIKKEAKQLIFPFITHHVGIIHDYDIALILSNQNKFAFIKDSLGFYRIHQAQQVGVKQVGKYDFSMEEVIALFSQEKIKNHKGSLKIYYEAYTKYKAIEKKLKDKSIEEKLRYQVKKRKTEFLNSLPFYYKIAYQVYWNWRNIYLTKNQIK